MTLPEKAPGSLLVSLADKTHNARAIVADRDRLGEAIWDRFNGGRDGTLWYYGALDRCFHEVLPGALATEFSRAVRAMAEA